MNLYLDSSALLKRYLIEDGTEEVRAAIESEADCIGSRITYVETMRALVGVSELAAQARRDWSTMRFIEVSPIVCDRAVAASGRHALRTLDAIHLGSALVVGADLTFATFDRRLHAAAQAEGLQTLPAQLS